MKISLNLPPSIIILFCNLLIYTKCSDVNYNLTYQYEIDDEGLLSSEYTAIKETRSKPHPLPISEQKVIEEGMLKFKILLDIKNLPQLFIYRKMLFHIKYNDEEIENFWLPKDDTNGRLKLLNITDTVECTLDQCNIGLWYCYNEEKRNNNESGVLINDYFYIILEVINSNNRFLLGTIKTPSYVNVIYLIICPGFNWVSKRGFVEYTNNEDDIVYTREGVGKYADKYVKIMNPWIKDEDKFTSCGHLKQKFGPTLDIGYSYEHYYASEPTHFPAEYPLEFDGETLMCEDLNISDPKLISYKINLPEYDFQSNRITINRMSDDPNFYSGQGIVIININEIKGWYEENGDAFNGKYEVISSCNVPNFNGKLYLRINNVLQIPQIIEDENYGSMDSFAIGNGTEDGLPADCLLEHENQNISQFRNMYVKRFKTSLQVFDDENKKYQDVKTIKTFKSNKKYKCSLIVPPNHPDVGELDFIEEYEFIIIGNGDLNDDLSQNFTETFLNNKNGSELLNSSVTSNMNTTKKSIVHIYLLCGIFGCLIFIGVVVSSIWIFKKRYQLKQGKSKEYIDSPPEKIDNINGGLKDDPNLVVKKTGNNIIPLKNISKEVLKVPVKLPIQNN